MIKLIWILNLCNICPGGWDRKHKTHTRSRGRMTNGTPTLGQLGPTAASHLGPAVEGTRVRVPYDTNGPTVGTGRVVLDPKAYRENEHIAAVPSVQNCMNYI